VLAWLLVFSDVNFGMCRAAFSRICTQSRRLYCDHKLKLCVLLTDSVVFGKCSRLRSEYAMTNSRTVHEIVEIHGTISEPQWPMSSTSPVDKIVLRGRRTAKHKVSRDLYPLLLHEHRESAPTMTRMKQVLKAKRLVVMLWCKDDAGGDALEPSDVLQNIGLECGRADQEDRGSERPNNVVTVT